MNKKLASGLLMALVISAAPAVFAATTVEATPAKDVFSSLSVDEFLTAGAVTTELVAAVICPIETLTCTKVNRDCGIYSGQCHCKAGGEGGSILVCVKNPGGGGGPIE